MKYIAALVLVLGVTLLWFAGSTHWYVCETQGLCEEKSQEKTKKTTESKKKPAAEVETPAPIVYDGPEPVIVYFVPNTSNFIDSSWSSNLQEMIDHLKAEPSARAEVNGYVALAGNITADQATALSRSRAEAVRDFIVDKGIEANRIDIKANATNNPVGTNANEQGRLLNRRAEITIK